MKPLRYYLNRLTLDIPKYPFACFKRTDRDKLLSLIERLIPQQKATSLVRLGPAGDGGYLIPDDLDGITACFSPGVADNSGFELACADMGMDIYMADGSIDRPVASNPKFNFIRSHIGSHASDELITLDQWTYNSRPSDDNDWIHQMDIEGDEYDVLISTSASLMKKIPNSRS